MTDGLIAAASPRLQLPRLLFGRHRNVDRAIDRLARRFAKAVLEGKPLPEPELVPVEPGTILTTGNVGEPVELWHLAEIPALIGLSGSRAYRLASERGSSQAECAHAKDATGEQVTALLFSRPWGVLGTALAFPDDSPEVFATRVDRALAHLDEFVGYRFKGHPDMLGFEFPEYDHLGLLELHLFEPLSGWLVDRAERPLPERLRDAAERMRAGSPAEARAALARSIARVRERNATVAGRMPAAVEQHEVQKRLAELPDEFVMQHRVGDMPDCIKLASRMWPE